MENSESSRFVCVTEERLDQLVCERIPKNTRKKVKWSVDLLKNWHNEWKNRQDTLANKVLKDVDEWTPEELNFCLRYFMSEIRKVDKRRYPPNTLKEIVAFNTISQIHCR